MKERLNNFRDAVNWCQFFIGTVALLIGTLVYLIDRSPDQTYFVYSSGIDISFYNILFRDFIDATANIIITESEVIIKFQKRSHNPLLIAAGFDKVDVRIPWFGKKRLQFILG